MKQGEMEERWKAKDASMGIGSIRMERRRKGGR